MKTFFLFLGLKKNKLFLRNPLPDLKWHALDLPAC